MAEERDPRCVLVVPERTVGEAVAAWLTEKKYPAELAIVGELAAPAGGIGLGDVPAPTLEVRVINPEHAEPARQLIAEQKESLAAARAVAERRAKRTGIVTAVCEECGKESEWPAAEMGTTQDCPHCGEYMDVPDPDENWEGIDFEGSEDEAAAGDGKAGDAG